MIRIGIVGSNYGRHVLLPAFRLEPRCRVSAVAGGNADRTAEFAREAGAEASADWSALVASDTVDLVAIATPPRLQAEIALRALALGKPLFIEKPMAADLAGADAMLRQAGTTPVMIDFNFTEIVAWKKAKALLDASAIGRLRHVAVNWNVENVSTRLRLKNWKTCAADGGGALGNLASHSLHYLEWFCGPIAGLSARLQSLPDDPAFETGVTLATAFKSGAAGSFAMSSAAYLGTGHRLEFYGEDGTLVLNNPTADYMRNFAVSHGRRPAAALTPVAVEDDLLDRKFPAETRIAPVSRLINHLIDAIEQRRIPTPGVAEGHRMQTLLDAVRRSHASGRWVETPEGKP